MNASGNQKAMSLLDYAVERIIRNFHFLTHISHNPRTCKSDFEAFKSSREWALQSFLLNYKSIGQQKTCLLNPIKLTIGN